MRVRSLVLLGLFLFLTAALGAQSHRESVTVEVIDVPVYVTRGGEPVEGLTRDDFELYVNGRRQAIEYFDSLASAPASLRERRLFLLLFDLAFTHPHSVARAQRAAAAAIEKAGPGDYFAVATYSARRGVWFAVPFTRDHAALTRAISNLNQTRSGDPLSIVMTRSERETFGESLSHGAIAGDTLRDFSRARTLRAAEEQVLDLGDLAERLAPLEGEKHVVILSEGYDGRAPNPFQARTMSSLSEWRRGGEPRITTLARALWDNSLTDQMMRTHSTYQRANVLLHAIDVEGVTYTMMANEPLGFLARGTGGHFLKGHNDVRMALDDLSDKVASGYRLGFRPANAEPGYNSIRVKVRAQHGVRVNHRRGFHGTPQRGNVLDGLYLADILLNDVPQTGTAATLELRETAVKATIPMREVAAQLASGANAEILLYAFDAKGTALLYHRQLIPVTDTEYATVEVPVPEGTRVAKALLRVDGMLGFSRVGG